MVGFANVGEYVDAQLAGRKHFCSFRKVPSSNPGAFNWGDLSMAAGNPPPNYYASDPLAAATLDSYRGLFHGPDQDGQKVLADLGIMAHTTVGFVGQYMLLDYLLYYPFVAMDDADPQIMDNTVTLPRYTDGEGVQVMAVCVTPTVGDEVFSFDYVNQDGVARTSPSQQCSLAQGISALVQTFARANSPPGPFLKLSEGDTGVRSVTSVTFSSPQGGLMAVVLVKPLADTAVREVGTMKEVNFLRDRFVLPVIENGAYLNLIYNCSATVSSNPIVGYANFAWSEGG